MSIDVYPNPVDVILGTMAQQDAHSVAITGGRMSVGGHAPTGVLDVQGSVVASDFPNLYSGVRVWPVAPSGAQYAQGLRIEAATGAALASANFVGIAVLDQPALASASALNLNMTSGSGRYNIYASGSAINYMAGHVGIANSTPTYPLDVTGSARVTGSVGVQGAPAPEAGMLVRHTKGSQHGLIIRPSDSDSGAAKEVLFQNLASAEVGSITTNATATSYNTSSDIRLKHAVQALGNALSTIQALRPVSFKWRVDDSPGTGFLAHELQQTIPEAVTGEPDALNDDGSIRPQQMDNSKLVPWLTAAMQELVAQVQTLQARVADLEARLA